MRWTTTLRSRRPFTIIEIIASPAKSNATINSSSFAKPSAYLRPTSTALRLRGSTILSMTKSQHAIVKSRVFRDLKRGTAKFARSVGCVSHLSQISLVMLSRLASHLSISAKQSPNWLNSVGHASRGRNTTATSSSF